jgi:hypothetical protein
MTFFITPPESSMSGSPLERVQQDLDTIRAALPTDFPYDRGSIALNLGASVCAILFALRAVPGWDSTVPLVLFVALATLGLAACLWLRRARSERGVRPQRWAWGRQEALAAVTALVALVFYAVRTRFIASALEGWDFRAWRGQLVAPSSFAFGTAMIILGIGRSERRSFLGWGIALVGIGIAAPWLASPAMVRVVAGAALAAGGAVSSLTLCVQLRPGEAVHGRH